MSISQIEESVKKLVQNIKNNTSQQDSFVYDLLLAYEHRKQSVSRLRTGERNLATKNTQARHDIVIWKRHVYFKHIQEENLHSVIDMMRKENLVSNNRIRFIIVTNFDQLLAVDTKTQDSLDISLSELPAKFDFFLPWAGMEKAVYQGENPADVKAAEKMAKLFDLIKGDNFDESNKDDTEALHGLNVFLTRLLFCFFAEDTEIFQDNQFSNAIQSHTKNDGSDLSDYLNRLFLVLNTADSDRAQLLNAPLPEYLDNFPYVNGGLFANEIPSPKFSTKSRRMLIECGSQLNWSDINPDIFGSMIQAVVHPDQRGGMGMHYTSVTNIMKVIEPLFLNDLYEELEKSENSATKLQKLQQRLGEIKIFDPACGSGNFLIIAYKELRKLEMEVLKRLQEIELEKSGQISQPFSVIKLSQFYGIELDDFAHEVAILSLWLAEHQMNVEFKTEFGEVIPALPLHNSGNVMCGNAARLNWQDVCKKNGEIYLLGNPPYLGGKKLSDENKVDMDSCGIGKLLQLDYICCWFIKASKFIQGIEAKCAFVSTKSICQGEQVGLLWPIILELNIEMYFAYRSFDWSNNAKNNAGVTCIILGLRNNSTDKKIIFSNNISTNVKNISPYLIDAKDIWVTPTSKPINGLPPMCMGSNPVDGKNLVVEKEEFEGLKSQNDPAIKKYINRYTGGSDFLYGKERYCLWIPDSDVEDALLSPFIKQRIESCEAYRKSAGRDAQKVASVPHRFCYRTHKNTSAIIFPKTTTDRRLYVPSGYTQSDTIINVDAFAIYDADLSIFSLLSSRMHVVWFSTTSGKLRTGFRYSVKMSYNTFPIPKEIEKYRARLIESALNILSIREKYPERNLAQLYDPDKMPSDLLEAHKKNDVLVESIYSKKEFVNDEDRLEALFTLYEKMTGGQNA
jgi:hypothetical protein